MYNAHLLPVLGAKHPRDWTKADCERVRDALDQKIRVGFWEREIKGKPVRYIFGWKRAWNVWALFTSACKEASGSKHKALRVREDNPCRDVKPPDRGASKQKQWLYPSEFLQLMTCDAVPMRWRILYAVLTYAYVRPNELKALKRRDVELDTGLIDVTRAWAFEKNIEKSNPKTAAGVRYVPIEFELMPLLRDLCAGLAPDDYLFPTLPPPEDWADTFRDHLRRAGIARTKLFENSATVKNITLYDLRATGITWRTLRGDDARIIQRAAGHEKYATTDGYVREASVFKGRIGDPFPALPKEFRSRVPITLSRSSTIFTGLSASPRGFEPENDDQDAARPAETSGKDAGRGTTEHDAGEPSQGRPGSGAPSDPVEAALAKAVELAASAGEWGAVAELGRELAARRLARQAPDVPTLDAARERRLAAKP